MAETAGELAELADEPNDVIHAAMVAGLLHDVGRVSDSSKIDPSHGLTSVALAKEKRLLELLEVQRERWEEVYEAIANHTHGRKTRQPIAQYLWDADRLCLVGFRLQLADPKRMSSRVWRRLCK